MDDDALFVRGFRGSAPYIHAHRGRVFVIHIEGEAMLEPGFGPLVHDMALLVSLGIKLVVVPGIRPQIEQQLARAGLETRFEDGVRVTDVEALRAVIESAGAARTHVEAMLSMGLANSPMHGAHVRVASGNYVTARPLGVRNGVDFAHTGEVRRIDVEAVRGHFRDAGVVLVSPLGYSPTGEVFNVRSDEVATEIAVALKAQKLLFLKAEHAVHDGDGNPARQLTLADAKALLAEQWHAEGHRAGAVRDYLSYAVRACRNGVARTHLVSHRLDGVLLLELFTRDGIGTMVSADPYDLSRRATIDDVGGILELISPLEERGVLVRRSRERLETEIHRFLVLERDGAVIACAAVYPFADEAVAELACLAVDDAYRDEGRGDHLLSSAEQEARAGGASRLFVLTTQATHWFKERGFSDARLEDLPVSRQELYNYERNSKVLVKAL